MYDYAHPGWILYVKHFALLGTDTIYLSWRDEGVERNEFTEIEPSLQPLRIMMTSISKQMQKDEHLNLGP